VKPRLAEPEVVVIGSGFGGSVTALRLAEAGKSVCVLERGHAWPPGTFARRPAEMAENFWDPSQGMHGLFDFWSFRHLEAIVSSGLGGGSLIYANVLLRKPEEWFAEDFGEGEPDKPLLTRRKLDPYYDRVEAMLSGAPYPYGSTTPKSRFMVRSGRRLGKQPGFPDLAVSFSAAGQKPGSPIVDAPGTNMFDVPRSTCRLCGECDIGCNYGSKNTLDLTYLSIAKSLGADIRVNCEVRSFEPCPGGYVVRYVIHHPENERVPMDTSRLPLREIRCRKLVLAAGALGSTFLLLRNRSAFPNLSSALGTRFSGNGDALAWIHGSPDRLEPSLGPVITTSWQEPDTVEGGTGPGYVVQDGGHPGFIDWLFQNSIPPVGAVARLAGRRMLQTVSGHPRSEIGAEVAALFGGGRRSQGILPLLAFGRDVPDGVLSLRDGYLEADLSDRSSQQLFDRIRATFAALAVEADGKLLTTVASWPHRRVTVHPLGGIPMGFDRYRGVVDRHGEVFGYPGFFVVDGSVMPGPVGTNPSLTIAALAELFSETIVRR
jgi:cholesterol oxidase